MSDTTRVPPDYIGDGGLRKRLRVRYRVTPQRPPQQAIRHNGGERLRRTSALCRAAGAIVTRSLLNWIRAPARPWQFWRPGSGPIGGLLFGVVACALFSLYVFL